MSVCQLVSEIAHAVEDLLPVKQGVYPNNLATEWEEFFSEGIYASLLPIFNRLTGKVFFLLSHMVLYLVANIHQYF